MRQKILVSLLFAVSLVVFAPLVEATALRVVTVETTDSAAYMQEIEKGKALFKKLGSPAEMRVWRGRFAGDDAGSIVVTIEYADLAALAKDEALLYGNAEFQAWIAALDKMRKVLSDSIYYEMGK